MVWAWVICEEKVNRNFYETVKDKTYQIALFYYLCYSILIQPTIIT